jgi:hypothetical protein
VKRTTRLSLLPRHRPETGVGERLAAMVRGLDALEFLERSREVAAEAVVAAPLRIAAGRPAVPPAAAGK